LEGVAEAEDVQSYLMWRIMLLVYLQLQHLILIGPFILVSVHL